MRRSIRLFVAAALLTLPGAAKAEAPAPTFTKVVAFGAKAGNRLIVAWEANGAVTPTVRFGTSPSNLNREAPTIPAVAATGGVVFSDRISPRAGGLPWYARLEDKATGAVSELIEVDPSNAYRAWNGSTYTINLVVRADTAALPDDVPHDQSLRNLAAGMNVLAERVYDAWDGFARLGKVLITEGPGPHTPMTTADCMVGVQTDYADIVSSTVSPFMSAAFLYGIESPCGRIDMGRMGWLFANLWPDDLEWASVAMHELGHYAFGTPDLYPTGGRSADATGVRLGPDCRNLEWDGSIMHNSGGWNAVTDRWEMTEVDRNPVLTPCRNDYNPYSWDTARYRYPNIPLRPNGPIEHIVDDQARGNEDGGALDIWILDRPAAGPARLTPYTPVDDAPVP